MQYFLTNVTITSPK